MKTALAAINQAMHLVTTEACKNGPEEGSRILDDPSNPLHYALMGLLQAKLALNYDKAAAILEDHSRQEAAQGL